MDKRSQIKVGLFLAIGIAVLATSTLLFGGDRALFTTYVDLKTNFEQVQGLNKGSVVSLMGINIGNVREIEFDVDSKLLTVFMKINQKYLAKIPINSTAEIRTSGALGDKFVYVIPGTNSSETVSQGDSIEAARGSDLMGILSEKGGDAAKIFEIIDELTKLMKTINAQNRSERIMANLAEASASLKSTSNDAQKIFAEFKKHGPAQLKDSIEKLNSILKKIDNGEGTLGALINDSTIHDQLKAYLGASSRKKSIQSLLKGSIDASKEPQSSP